MSDKKISMQAFIFEIRNLNRIGNAKKYKFSQTSNLLTKDKIVNEWKEIQCKKSIIKILALNIFNLKKSIKNETGDVF